MPKIKSDPNPDNPRPWFEYDLAGDAVTFRKANGISAAVEHVPPQAEQALLKRHPLRRSDDTAPNPDSGVAPADEVHVLAITLDGDVEFVPQSQQRPVYYAHLAWQHPDGTWDALEFVES